MAKEKVKTVLMYADGKVQEVVPGEGKKFTLKELQGFVGGLIQIVSLPKTGGVMVMDDEGRLKKKHVNGEASQLFRKNYPVHEFPENNDGIVVGDVVVCENKLIR